ncbi:MAG: hypothetical protein ACRD0K_21475 [Egibacteraceae bacterium]
MWRDIQVGKRLLLAAALAVTGLAVLLLPHRFEGVVLVVVAPGRRLTTTDLIGLTPLAAAEALLYSAARSSRRRVR